MLIVILLCVTTATMARRSIQVTPDSTVPCICKEHWKCFSLQHVLTHHDLFFMSNTTFELLPGKHVVNESYTNTLTVGIEHFAMVAVHGHATIHCTKHGKLRLFFIDVANVTLSGIHFSNCSGGEPNKIILGHLATFNQGLNEQADGDLGRYTITFAFSSHISITRVTIDHADGIAIMVMSVYNGFQLSHSNFSHNTINCVLMTMEITSNESFADNIDHEYQKYEVTNSLFSFGKSKDMYIASGLNVLFAHKRTDTVDLVLRGLTFHMNKAYNGNLMIAFVTCTPVTRYAHSGQTNIAVSDTTSTNTGEWDKERGIVVTTWIPECKSHFNMNTTLVVENTTFNRSCILLQINLNGVVFKNTTVVNTSCTCEHSLSMMSDIPIFAAELPDQQTKVVLETIRVVDSCGSGSLFRIFNSSLALDGENTFARNSGAVFIQNSDVVFKGNVSILNNTSHGSPFLLEDSTLYNEGHVVFGRNTGGNCGGMSLMRSKVYLNDIQFIGNRGKNGGALAMYDGSKVIVTSEYPLQPYFKDNFAEVYGGAIYVDDPGYQNRQHNEKLMLNCFTESDDWLNFDNNTALTSGNTLYGGWLDFCYSSADYPYTRRISPIGNPQLKNRFEINDLSAISSNPSRICLCFNYIPNCNITTYEHKKLVSPGQSVEIEAVAVGQRFGTVPSTVNAEFVKSSVKVDKIQKVQNVEKYCTTLNYTIKTPRSEEVLLLSVEKNYVPEILPNEYENLPDYDGLLLLFDELHITLKISSCPLGYSFDSVSNTCICQKTLTQNDIQCYIQNQTVIRRKLVWINVTFTHTHPQIGNPGVILHHNCPFDYCKNLNQQYLDLRYPDEQCAYGRAGILCGECPQNYSHVFGTSKCKKCSNVWIVLVLSLFILTGTGLVALLIILNLTVSIGTINGLIFYAHIVRANQAAFFPPQMTNTFLSWFIAWLNLDLGIEMCFFDGLDAYIKTWLQFLFPIYIWVLVIAIIASSHYSTFAARLSGTNAVQVLATLFIMSYAKMLRITITALSSTTLDYPDGYPRRVWLYDGNVDYLKDKHIPLFIAALILLIFLSIPYTLVLLTIQRLRLLPSYKVLFWVRKVKPLFDAYTGVYKCTHGYWTGLLLLVRVGLFLVFALNILGDPSINLLAVVGMTFIIITYLSLFGGVYRQRYLNFIEYSYLLNLGMLSAVTLYTRLVEHSQENVIKTSVGIALSTFILTVIYHACQQFKSTQKGGICVRYLNTKFVTPLLDKLKSAKDAGSAIIIVPPVNNRREVTHSSIELREPLLID